jgi:hypothetical protein
MRTLFGKYQDASIKLSAGTLVIDENQPLGCSPSSCSSRAPMMGC